MHKATPQIMVPDFTQLDKISYCIHCKDMGSELYGTFAYDEELYASGCGYWAISPVFENVTEFYYWAKTKGYKYHDLNSMLTLSKRFV